MRYLVAFVLCLLATHADAASWFIRSPQSCENHGDGKSYACAGAPGAPGAYNTATPGALNWSTSGIKAGDTIYICGTIKTPFSVPDTAAGTAAAPITVSFDCPNDPGKIRRITEHHGPNVSSTWIEETTGLWYLQLSMPNSPKRVWRDGVELIRSESKELLGTFLQYGPLRAWWHDGATNRLYFSSPVNPTLTFKTLESLAATNTTCDFAAMCFQKHTNRYFTIINPNLEGGNLGALYIAGASFINVYGTSPEKCHIGGHSNRGIYIGDTAANGTGWPAHDNKITDCTLDPLLGPQFDGYQHEWNGITHDGVFAADGNYGNTFARLTVRNWQHTGIALVGLRASGAVTNNIVEDIHFVCDDFIEYCRAFAIDGLSAGKASGNIIRNSVIENMTVRSQYNGDHNELSHNFFLNQRIGTVTLGKYNFSQVIEIQSYVGPSTDNLIKENIFYHVSTAPCISFRPDAYEERRYIIEGNTFIGCGGIDMPEAPYVAIYWPEHTLVSDHVIRNNTFIQHGTEFPILYKTSGRISASSLNALCPTCTGNIELSLTSSSFVPSSAQCGMNIRWFNVLRTYNLCLAPKG